MPEWDGASVSAIIVAVISAAAAWAAAVAKRGPEQTAAALTGYSSLTKDLTALNDRVTGQLEELQQSHECLEKMVKAQARRIAALEETEHARARYDDWLARRERAHQAWARRQGVNLPPPRFQTFTEWLEAT